MSIERVREYLAQRGAQERNMDCAQSTATVHEAAQTLGVEGARIAKTLYFRNKAGDGCIILVAAGDVRIDNKAFRAQFGVKPRMCTAEEAVLFTGHAVGGVCPFALPEGVPVYMDESLRRFDIVYPAAGNAASAVRLTPEELFELSGASEWVNVAVWAE